MKRPYRWTVLAALLAGVTAWTQDAPPAGPVPGRRDPPGPRGPGDRPRFERGQGPGRREGPPEFRRELGLGLREGRGNIQEIRERMRQFMAERVRERLQVNDDDWAVLEPMIQRVTEARRMSRPGVAASFARAGRWPGEGERQDALLQAAEALRSIMGNESATPEEIQARLAAYRAARAEAEAELKKAQEELRGLLTVRQEAELVLMGLLD